MKKKNSLILLFFYLCFTYKSNGQTKYGNNPQYGKYIVLNGVNHYYETYGEGTPVLLIHGNFTATRGWAPQIEFFSKKYKVYSIDCRGRGKSDLGKDTTKNWLVEQQRYRLDEFQPNITAKELNRIKIPVLVMSTDRDVIKEEHTFFIYKNIPFANLCILTGEKHRVAWLNPELFNKTVDAYLSKPFQGYEFRFEN